MNLPKNLILKQMEIGPARNFQYFVGDARTKEIAVVDPAWDVKFLCSEIKKAGYKVVCVYLTHGHRDHVNGLEEFLKSYDVPAYICKYEADFYKPKHKNLKELDNHAKLKIGQLEFECLWTPGHSPGCLCLRYENVLIAGDTIFIDGCGRCDLPGSDPRKQYHSLYEVVMKLPDDTLLFPGHNYGPVPFATVGEQKETNPYLTCGSLNEFLEERMGTVA